MEHSHPHPSPKEQAVTTRQLAGIGTRFLAKLIDGFVLGAVFVVLIILYTNRNGDAQILADELGPDTDAVTMANLLRVGIEIAYATILVGYQGATLGKLAMGIEVVTEDGTRPGYGTALVRGLVSLLSGAILLLGYIWAFFNPQKQSWHDLAARTYVVTRKPVS
jgi:uncharacterized RDD family membrane protein YckC